MQLHPPTVLLLIITNLTIKSKSQKELCPLPVFSFQKRKGDACFFFHEMLYLFDDEVTQTGNSGQDPQIFIIFAKQNYYCLNERNTNGRSESSV
jgi:hypothetical protein